MQLAFIIVNLLSNQQFGNVRLKNQLLHNSQIRIEMLTKHSRNSAIHKLDYFQMSLKPRTN